MKRKSTKRKTLGEYADAEPSNPVGRPNEGISEAKINVRMSGELLSAMQGYADSNDISLGEAWRRAARAFLGLENALPEDA